MKLLEPNDPTMQDPTTRSAGTDAVLGLQDVSHVYPNGTRALDHVTLSIPRGMYGLLGPNGAGKSTLMRTIATLQTPTEGTIRFGDIDVIAEPERLRRTLGYLPQDFGVYPRISAYDMLDHMAVLKGIASPADRRTTVETLLHQTNLWDVRKKALAGLLRRHAPALRHRAGADRQSRADHRRRAHGRSRSGGAEPVPEPARRDRRERGRDPLDAHRGGRVGPLPADGGAGRTGASSSRGRRSS